MAVEVREREIIVVDDGSDVDVSRELAAVCPDLIYIRRENGGLSAARNTGIEAAKGRYMQFVDGDDRLIPKVYDRIVDKLRHTQADLLLFGFTENENRAVGKAKWKCFKSGAAYLETRNMKAPAWGYVFKSALLSDGLRFPVGRYHEDEYFTPRLVARAGETFITACTPYFYTLRGNSITTLRSDSHMKKRLDDQRDAVFSLAEYCGADGQRACRGMERRICQLTMDYIFNTITSGLGREELQRRINELQEKESPRRPFYTLPLRFYTLKYFLFAMFANRRAGLSLLYKALSRLKRRR